MRTSGSGDFFFPLLSRCAGYITQGPQVEAFEAELRDYFGNPHVLTTNSCTAATHLAFRLLKKVRMSPLKKRPLSVACGFSGPPRELTARVASCLRRRVPLARPSGLTRARTSDLPLARVLLASLLQADPAASWPGYGPGDEVLSCPLTCTATNWPALANGLKLKCVGVAALGAC